MLRISTMCAVVALGLFLTLGTGQAQAQCYGYGFGHPGARMMPGYSVYHHSAYRVPMYRPPVSVQFNTFRGYGYNRGFYGGPMYGNPWGGWGGRGINIRF